MNYIKKQQQKNERIGKLRYNEEYVKQQVKKHSPDFPFAIRGILGGFYEYASKHCVSKSRLRSNLKHRFKHYPS